MLPGFIVGLVAELLRRGLQILAPRFDSGRGLQTNSSGTTIRPISPALAQGPHISAETMLDRRVHMVNSQLRTGGIVDKVVLAAFLDVPRQRFVASEHES